MEEQKAYFTNSNYYITPDNNTPTLDLSLEEDNTPQMIIDINFLLKDGIILLNKIDELILNYQPENINHPIILTNDKLKYYYLCSKISRNDFQQLYSIFMSLRKLFKYFYFYNPFEETLEELYNNLYNYHLFEFESDISNEKILIIKTQFKNPVFLNFIHYLKSSYKSFTNEKNRIAILGFKKYFTTYEYNTEENEYINLTFTEEENPFVKKYIDYPTDNEDFEDVDLKCQEKFDTISDKIEEMELGN